MDPEPGPSKPTFRRRKWNTAAYDTYSDGFTFREELNFEYDTETSSSDSSESESDPEVIDLPSEDEEQEREKRDRRGRALKRSNSRKRKDRIRRWRNLVKTFKSLQKWRIRSMDAIFLHAFDNWHVNGFNSNSRQAQDANMDVEGLEQIADISVVVENELSRNNGAFRAANFVPSPQESQVLNGTTQRGPNFAVQTLPPIQEFFASSTSEFGEIPPTLMQDRTFRSATGFAVEPSSMTQNGFRPSATGFAVKPRPPMRQNLYGPSTSANGALRPSSMQDRPFISVAEFAMERPSMMQNTFRPRASIPRPPLAPLSPFMQNRSDSEIAAVPPPSTQTRSSLSTSRFGVELPSMTPNMYRPRSYAFVPQPSPFLQNTSTVTSSSMQSSSSISAPGQAMAAPSMSQNMFGSRASTFIPPPSPFLPSTSTGEFSAEPPSFTQNVFRPGVPGSSATSVPYGITPPIVPSRPQRIASQPLPLMLNESHPRSYETRPQSTMQQNRFSASRGYDDQRFVNGVPASLSGPPPLIPITPELYPICDQIVRRQRELRRLQQQKNNQG